MDKQEPIHVIAMVKREMKKKHLCAADIARSLNVNHSTVFGGLKRPTIQVQKLLVWCELLQYNFFKEIATQLPYSEPKDEDNPVIMRQQDRIKELEIENQILRQTLKELVAAK